MKLSECQEVYLVFGMLILALALTFLGMSHLVEDNIKVNETVKVTVIEPTQIKLFDLSCDEIHDVLVMTTVMHDQFINKSRRHEVILYWITNCENKNVD